MLIENPEAFKSWLTSVLEPLCEADPEALAKYVYALVKKDRPVDMLRESMVEQLDVFLQNETKPFVELLFKTLETQEYILPTPIPNANPPNPNPPAVVKSEPPAEICLSKEVKAIIPVSSLPDLTADVNGTAAAAAKKDKEPEPPTTTTATHRKDRDREHKKTDLTPAAGTDLGTLCDLVANTRFVDKEEKGVRATRPRHRSSSRNRSRSRSWERSRRSRSRERSRERERRERSRPWRNKSPPRRYERRRSRSNSPNVPRRSRSPRHNYRGRYRNRSPPRSLSRSRSRSLEKHSDKDKVRDPKDSNKEPLSGAGTPTQDSNHGDTDMRLTSSTQSIQSVVAANTAEGSVAPPPGATTVAGVFPSKRRCRDFDEKGYCMRGELCPYDHGVDPVVLEDTALSSVLTFGPNGQPPIDGAPGPGMLPPPMIRPSHVMHPHHMPPRQMHPMPPEYNPSAPSMWNPRARFGGAPMTLPGAPPRGGMFHAPLLQPAVGHIAGPGHNHVQRELISVPVHDNTSDNNFQRRNDYPVENQDNNNQLKKKTGFDFSRVGPRTKNPVNCSLELKKVPRGLNNITHLNNHFSKFGKIVNIQVSYEGDPEAALITFSSHAEANAAYRSTEAVLNNRFIKVFWHNNNEGKQENVPPQRSIKDRLGQQVGPTASISGGNKVLNLVQPKATNSTGTPASNDSRNDKVANSSNSFNKLYIPNAKPASQESKAQANSVLQKKQEIIAVKKRQEEARKDMAKMNQDLVKRTHKLLEEQIAHQKQLIEKLEKGNVQGQKKEELKVAIQKLQQSIEDIRKSLMASVKQKAANQIVHAAKITQARKSKEEAQKEFLDAELDLITKQQEGADTSALQKKVSELKARALSLGNTPKITRGSLALRLPRGNKYLKVQRRSFTHQTIDHRPTKLLVSGYESEEKTDVVAHFAKFGEILDYISDDSTPSVILNFKTRKEAEMAVLKGKHFQDRTLSVTWCTSSQLNSQMSSNRNTARTVLLNDSDEDRLLESTITEEEDGVAGAGDLTADLNEEALLQDDEEEEEENEEDRSWRR